MPDFPPLAAVSRQFRRPRALPGCASGISGPHPRLVEYCMLDIGAAVRGEDQMDLAVPGLDRERIGVVVRPHSEVVAEGPAPVAVWRQGDGERRAVVHVVV